MRGVTWSKTVPYLILLSFQGFILWVLGGNFVGAIVVSVDNFGFGHFECEICGGGGGGENELSRDVRCSERLADD